jgi:hypothetical protein
MRTATLATQRAFVLVRDLDVFAEVGELLTRKREFCGVAESSLRSVRDECANDEREVGATEPDQHEHPRELPAVHTREHRPESGQTPANEPGLGICARVRISFAFCGRPRPAAQFIACENASTWSSCSPFGNTQHSSINIISGSSAM